MGALLGALLGCSPPAGAQVPSVLRRCRLARVRARAARGGGGGRPARAPPPAPPPPPLATPSTHNTFSCSSCDTSWPTAALSRMGALRS